MLHLTASEEERRRRFEARRARGPAYEAQTFDLAMEHETEAAAETLSASADMVLDTTSMTPEEVASAVRPILRA